MRVRGELKIEVLLNYGFDKINKKKEEENENYTLSRPIAGHVKGRYEERVKTIGRGLIN